MFDIIHEDYHHQNIYYHTYKILINKNDALIHYNLNNHI